MNSMTIQQNLLYQINIFEEDIVLTDNIHGGGNFIITQEQLMQFVRSETTFRPEPGLIWKKSDGLTDRYLIHLPKETRNICVKNGKKRKTYTLQFPSLMFLVHANRSEITSLNVWCFAGCLRDESPLYEVPLPNISGSAICLGSSDKRIGRNIRESIERIFFDSVFNNHWNIVGKEKLSFQAFHNRYKGKMPFHKLNMISRGRKIIHA